MTKEQFIKHVPNALKTIVNQPQRVNEDQANEVKQSIRMIAIHHSLICDEQYEDDEIEHVLEVISDDQVKQIIDYCVRYN